MRLITWLELEEYELLDNLLVTETRRLSTMKGARPQDHMLLEYLKAELHKGDGRSVLERPANVFEEGSIWTYAWHPGSWLRAKLLEKSYREVMRDYFSRMIKGES